MRKKQIYTFLILFILLLSFSGLFFNGIHSKRFSIDLLEDTHNDPNLKVSNNYQENIIVFFDSPSYNDSVRISFETYGGIIKKEWNNQFQSISGFAGNIPLENNLTAFQNEFPDAIIENDEILETQMNYASIQSGAINSTWYLNGLMGDTNSSIAVLDTGVNSNHDFLTGDILGWENFVDSQPISDDNGHGTFISSVISGTGTEPFDSITPSLIKISGNYSHTELFDEFSVSKNYTLKIISINASKANSNIFINSSWNLEVSGIDGFWFELYKDDTLVKSTVNATVNLYYTINHTLTQTSLGIYDLYLKYHKQLLTKPTFSFNTQISYFPEVYIENRTHFTGIANATKIVAYKILNQSGIGYTSDLISAFASVIQNRTKYHIVSVCLSVGSLGEDIKAINSVINEVIENGIIVVISAGNTGIELSDSLNKLAENKNAIVVGAINDEDQVTSYSSMGKEIDSIIKPDIVAPGGSKLGGHRSIIAADKEIDKATSAYGTSIATAIVSASINLLIEARWNDWNQWNNLNLTEWAKYLKAFLLMTASETNTEREDDPFTLVDESDYSPSLSLAPLTSGLKDIHEGYGRINIQAAIDALTKNVEVNSSINGNLVSSQRNPLGRHVFARQIKLDKDIQYSFNLDVPNFFANFDMFLFSNESNQYGEPILLESSRKEYGDFDYFYFTPKEKQTNCVIVIKAVQGRSDFTLNISTVNNYFEPELKVPEINYASGSKNTTIMSLQEYMGNEPKKNYSIDSYRFYIEYYDNDTSNVPPQEVYVCIIEESQNFTLSQYIPSEDNYTNGVLFLSDYIQFNKTGLFHYFFVASDGMHKTRYPETGFLNITIEFPTDSIQFPHFHNFNEGLGNWSYTGTGWGTLYQSNMNDNRSRIYENPWNSLYFGTYHDYPMNYTYQPVSLAEDPFPNGSLISPLCNLTNIDENSTNPFVYFGLRTSINAEDFIYLQINLNWTGWVTLRIYTNIENEWFLEQINLTQYIGNFIQFRFETSLDNSSDPINYKGLILDYFALVNKTNENSPSINFNLNNDISSTQDSKYQKYTFSIEYFDLDNNYPEYVYLEMNSINYTMYNIYGDWNASSNKSGDRGIYFIKSLLLGEISNKTFRFHASDGLNLKTSQWYNKNNSLFEFINPSPLYFNVFKDNKFIGYSFSNIYLSDYYVTGTPTPKEATDWFRGDNSWHLTSRYGNPLLYGGRGLSYGSNEQGYGPNWDINLITRPLHLESEYNIYLEFDYEISLQNEYYTPEDQLDKCTVSISKDFGETWILLREFVYDDEDLSGSKKFDISTYSNDDIMIKFALHSNGVVIGLGWGWLLSNIYVGYDRSTDFIAPEIDIIDPEPDTTVRSTIKIKANISDNIELDESRIYIFLNNRSVERSKLKFNSNTSTLEFDWNTAKNNDGTYEIKVVAYDKEGNIGEASIIVKVNNMKWWSTWGPYIIIFVSVIAGGILIYYISEKKGKIWIGRIKDSRAEKIRLKDFDKDQVIKRIELVEHEEELARPLTLYCKSCRSWFYSSKFDILCPNCGYDQIYAAYLCENCNKWSWRDEPRENYYCKNKTCEGVRLIRREKEEIQEILAQEGKVLKKFESKKKKFSILDE
ncbi:MAG: S8 family serine peptidase [Candidatus Hodarchaeota archaeon]